MSVSEPTKPTSKRLGIGWYMLAGVSFFPLIGVPFGLISIIIGLFRRSSGGLRLVAMGSAGIALTIVIYGSIFVAGKTGRFDGVTAQLTQRLLNDSVRSIEFYKLQNGEYPESLEAVKAENPFVHDPFVEKGGPFSYVRHAGGSSYSIFSVGPDRIPSTEDDLYPSPASVRGSGYRKP